MDRREFIGCTTVASLGLLFPGSSQALDNRKRRFHVCLNTDVLEQNPELIEIVKNAGINTVWLPGFFYGYWPYPMSKIQAARRKIEQAGMSVGMITIPLGHPGDSLGSKDGDFPLTPPPHWRTALKSDGSQYVGTSLHKPATSENAEAVGKLYKAGYSRIFLDDDFRLAIGPGQIGGCYCEDHCNRFLKKYGYKKPKWEELLGDVHQRSLTHLLNDWINFTCDELTGSFRAQQKMMGEGQLGIMVMHLGAEKAGIRLTDYSDALFRVGELMFDDKSFNRIKGKTDELFSALMHRRFTSPELAYSETTAYPANALSAQNISAKLVISTITDVRNTMFMSGLTPFHSSHWETIGPAMKIQSDIHQKLAGHKPRGPFKHYWGEYSRKIGDDKPNSLFLASGVPFEITDKPAQDGWTFLSNYDAKAVQEKKLASNGTVLVHRPGVSGTIDGAQSIDESLDALFAFKQRNIHLLKDVPYVKENLPVVCAWYPSAKSVLLWNLSQESKAVTLQYKDTQREVTIPGLASRLIEELV